MNLLNEMMKQELQKFCEVLFDEPMSRYTSIRIGGMADALVYPKSVEELAELIRFASRHRLPYFVLGAGSNLLVRDSGIRGLVISLSKGFAQIRQEGETTLYAEAGVGLPRLVEFAAEKGIAGLEPLCGIPGNIGGAVVMNAGTSEGETKDFLKTVTFMDSQGKLLTWGMEKIRFGYRESHFPRGALVLSARFEGKRGSPEEIRRRIQSNREKRTTTQPLNVPNLGSVFKNPGKGFAGRYIEEAGLKAVRVGKARISERHANFILNEGGAKAQDVLALIDLIQDKVKERFGVRLEPEVKIVGEE